MQPTESARLIRLTAIRRRDAESPHLIQSGAIGAAVLDRRWLLQEIDRLHAERDAVSEQLATMLTEHDKDTP